MLLSHARRWQGQGLATQLPRKRFISVLWATSTHPPKLHRNYVHFQLIAICRDYHYPPLTKQEPLNLLSLCHCHGRRPRAHLGLLEVGSIVTPPSCPIALGSWSTSYSLQISSRTARCSAPETQANKRPSILTLHTLRTAACQITLGRLLGKRVAQPRVMNSINDKGKQNKMNSGFWPGMFQKLLCLWSALTGPSLLLSEERSSTAGVWKRWAITYYHRMKTLQKTLYQDYEEASL